MGEAPDSVSSEDYERHIALENGLNFRDVGGYVTAEGRRVRWRQLFRAGSLSELSPADLDVLRELEVATVVDLRSTGEWEADRFPTHELPVEFFHLPLIEQMLDPAELANYDTMMLERYQEVARIGAANIAQAIAVVADARSHPVVVHCLAGKDRTGIVIALVLSLVGVDDETVARDYALSDLAMARLRERAEASAATVARSEELAKAVFTAAPANILGLFETLRAEHGSLEGYLGAAGLAPDTVPALRQALLE